MLEIVVVGLLEDFKFERGLSFYIDGKLDWAANLAFGCKSCKTLGH
jgi:hypothetical protein